MTTGRDRLAAALAAHGVAVGPQTVEPTEGVSAATLRDRAEAATQRGRGRAHGKAPSVVHRAPGVVQGSGSAGGRSGGAVVQGGGVVDGAAGVVQGSQSFIAGDCRVVLRDQPSDSVDLIFADPGIGGEGDGWDRGVPGAEYWETFFRVAKPGAHLAVFSSRRFMHRVVTRAEDAGFVPRDTLLWVYPKGMPMSLDIGQAVDRKMGGAGEPYFRTAGSMTDEQREGLGMANPWYGWGTELRPTWESISVLQKPYRNGNEALLGYCATIDGNLSAIERSLWSLLAANNVVLPSSLSPAECGAGMFGGVRWHAERQPSQADTSMPMGMSTSAETIAGCWNTVRSWRTFLVALSNMTNTYTIAMESRTITDLRTLKSLVSLITPDDMVSDATHRGGSKSPASNVGGLIAQGAVRLDGIRIHSAPGRATSPGHTSPPAGPGRESIWGNPTWEPISILRKPCEGSVADNVLKWRTGAMNIDASRIPVSEERDAIATYIPEGQGDAHGLALQKFQHVVGKTTLGRWPADALFSHAPECGLDVCAPGCAVGALEDHAEGTAKYFYCCKADRKEKDVGLGDKGNTHKAVKPVAVCSWITTLLCPPLGVLLDPFCGTGSIALGAIRLDGCRYLGIDIEPHWLDLAQRRLDAYKRL